MGTRCSINTRMGPRGGTGLRSWSGRGSLESMEPVGVDT